MAFVFKITTTGSPQTFTIPCQNVGTFNATVDWGDGGPTSSITAYNDADLAHSYATAGQYTITITGTFPNIYFNTSGDRLLVDEVVDLGNVGWQALNQAFYGCSNMTAFNVGTADTSGVTNMRVMFANCSSLTSLDLTGFDTSNVSDLQQMFYACTGLTSLNVSTLNTSSATSMRYMFYQCTSLTSLDVSSFDTSSVTNMEYMFLNCSTLTSLDVSSFDTSSVTNMRAMFYGCSGLTSLDVSSFDTSSVTNMREMFLNCSKLISLYVSGWNTSNVTSMYAIFYGCNDLTFVDVSGFNTASVNDIRYMFAYCFDLTTLDVSAFDVSSVTSMYGMFRNCSSLTFVDVSNWDTSSVTSMGEMFYNCTNLTGLQISGWDVSSVTNGTVFLSGANNALSTQEYNNTLRAWSQQSVQSGVSWHFGDATYDENHPDTRYYLDFDGVDDNLILDGTDFGSSTNATLYKTFRGDSTDTEHIMFATLTAAWILVADQGSTTVGTASGAGTPVFRQDGAIKAYTNWGDVFTELIDNTDHTIGVEEANLSVQSQWTNPGFYIGGELGSTWDSTGRLYSWAAVDTRLDGRNRDLLENYMISKKP